MTAMTRCPANINKPPFINDQGIVRFPNMGHTRYLPKTGLVEVLRDSVLMSVGMYPHIYINIHDHKGPTSPQDTNQPIPPHTHIHTYSAMSAQIPTHAQIAIAMHPIHPDKPPPLGLTHIESRSNYAMHTSPFLPLHLSPPYSTHHISMCTYPHPSLPPIQMHSTHMTMAPHLCIQLYPLSPPAGPGQGGGAEGEDALGGTICWRKRGVGEMPAVCFTTVPVCDCHCTH